MLRACLVLLLAALAAPGVSAQPTEQRLRASIVSLIEGRLQAQQELDVIADSVVLTGKVLHLKGHVRLVCGSDTFVLAEEATIEAAAAKVELIGNVSIFRGSPARIERW
jgi:hypothetical protein